ncbi:MAG TPA: hypothetical protein VGH74_12670, partial [Planctomycetaceae bacterium]
MAPGLACQRRLASLESGRACDGLLDEPGPKPPELPPEPPGPELDDELELGSDDELEETFDAELELDEELDLPSCALDELLPELPPEPPE